MKSISQNRITFKGAHCRELKRRTRFKRAAVYAHLVVFLGVAVFLSLGSSLAAGFRQVLEQREWTFPRDHGRPDGSSALGSTPH
jgi:hypothetical protein